MACKHEDAVYSVEFNRYSDEQGVPRKFTADIAIFCAHCRTQFRLSGPRVSADELTLTADLEPDMPLSDALDLRDLFLTGHNDE